MSTSSIWSARAHHLVGHRLLLLDAGDLGDDVVEALQVLDVDGGDDGDAGVEQLLDVLPALGVLAARGVGVGEFVDQHHLGAGGPAPRRTSSSGKLPAAVVDVARRDDLDAVEQLGGLLAAVGLDDRGDHVGAALEPAVRLAEHREGLADAGRRAQVDAQLPALRLVACSAPAGSADRVTHAPSSTGHQLFTGYFWSSARLSSSTLTRGSPRKPERRGRAVWSATSLRGPDPALTPRALATRATCRSA